MSNRCPACGSHQTEEIHDFRRECMDCREIFDPTMDNGDSEFDPEDSVPEGEEPHDPWDREDFEPDYCMDLSDDAEVLASAGWWSDADYGYFDGDD